MSSEESPKDIHHLQALIGGGDHQGLDLADMRSHVNYAGGYHEDHPVIKGFWQVSLLPA